MSTSIMRKEEEEESRPHETDPNHLNPSIWKYSKTRQIAFWYVTNVSYFLEDSLDLISNTYLFSFYFNSG